MTARWAHLSYELIEKVSNRIINEIENISRVVYDVPSEPRNAVHLSDKSDAKILMPDRPDT